MKEFGEQRSLFPKFASKKEIQVYNLSFGSARHFCHLWLKFSREQHNEIRSSKSARLVASITV